MNIVEEKAESTYGPNIFTRALTTRKMQGLIEAKLVNKPFLLT